MGDCVRNFKRIAVVDGSGSGSSTAMVVSKKRRIIGLTSSDVELHDARFCFDSPEKTVNSGRVMNAGDLCTSFCMDQFPVSCCSSNESSEVVRDGFSLIDLEAKGFETVDSTTSINNNNNKFSREATPSSSLCVDSDEMDSLAAKKNHPPAKMPPKEEIEDFFAFAEKREQKRFAENYNYDIVKDVPLEGRYQWIPLKP
ncbi:cyclin-dependent kinase inhibitor 7 isoform X1 [Quercus suber]|uniref:Cyclin-dependent kinase inhibitor 7 n=1 Tax=Quercus suber TaxID=58331 RepID=A0AAW0KPY9_QUESU|nr:cyclin-dependent kinase inhibitor 7-like isoform X2 [Quercus suber]POF09993.1 cyclin-dependent kinase inhibitor 7 [Quercus suber]